jgi:hypothetical protein
LQKKQSRHDTELAAGKFANAAFVRWFCRRSAGFFRAGRFMGERVVGDQPAPKSFTGVKLYNSA